MDARTRYLRDGGYEIVWMAGDYCRACREGHDYLLRWNGAVWLLLSAASRAA